MELKALKSFYKEIEAMYGRERQGAFQVGPITWLQLDFLGLVTTTFQQMGFFNPRFFYKWASQPMTLLQMGFLDPYFSQQKNGACGYANSQTRNMYKAMENINYSHRMPQAPRVLMGLMLIPIFVTRFVQARFKQARLSCELNSCIMLYFILLSMAQAHATYGEIEEVWFGGYGLVPFKPFA